MDRESFKAYLKGKGYPHRITFCGDGPVMLIDVGRHKLNVLMPSNPNANHLPCVEQFIKLYEVMNRLMDVVKVCDVEFLEGETDQHCQRLSITSLYQEILE